MPKSYTFAEKTRVMDILISHSLNILKTAEETGLSRNTIKKFYYELYSEHLNEKKPESKNLQTIKDIGVVQNIPDLTEHINDNVSTLKNEVIKRLTVLVPGNKNVKDLAYLLSVIQEYEKNPTDPDDANVKTQFIQNIYNQITIEQQKNGKKNLILNGDKHQ